MEYTSNYHLVNVYANGEYLGLYGVATKQEYLKYIEEDEIKAVFAFTYVEYNNFISFTTTNDTSVQVLYGEESYVQEIVEAFEAALIARDYEEVYKYIDFESFANKYALEEYLVNWDISWMSQYFYIGADGKIRCMCAWDYDNSIYKCVQDILENLPTAVRAYYSQYQMNGASNFWWRTLISDDTFRAEVANIIETKYTDEFYEHLFEQIEECVEEIDASWQCNYKRWHNETTYLYPTCSFETIEEYLILFQQILSGRSAFLIDYMQNKEDYCLIEFLDLDGKIASVCEYSNVCLPKGTILNSLIEEYGWNSILEDYDATWQTADGITIDEVAEVTEDMVFYVTLAEAAEEDSDQDSSETAEGLSTKARIKAWLRVFTPAPVLRVNRLLGTRNTLILCGFGMLYLLALIAWFIRLPRNKRNSHKGESR